MSAFLFLFFFASAHAYAPEQLLQKSLSPQPELQKVPRAHSFNPFTSISVGLEKGRSTEKGISPTSNASQVQTRDVREDSKELTVEFKPKGLIEAVEYNGYLNVLREQSDTLKGVLESGSLLSAYQLLATAASAKEEEQLLAEWEALLERTQKLSALEAKQISGDARSIMKASLDAEKTKNELIEMRSILEGVKDSLNKRGLTLSDLEISDILEPGEILERMQKLPKPELSLSAAKLQNELEVARKSLSYEVARNNRWLDAVEFSYGKGKEGIFESYSPLNGRSTSTESRDSKSYAVKVTLNLPFLTAKDLGEIKDRLKLAEAEVGTSKELSEIASYNRNLERTITQKAKLYVEMESSGLSKVKVSESLLRQSPSFALELQKTTLARKMLLAKLRSEIRNLYAELLHERGVIAAQPKINHFSKSGREI